MCTTVLSGCWGGGKADRNITHISKAAFPSPGPGCRLKVVLHPQKPSWMQICIKALCLGLGAERCLPLRLGHAGGVKFPGGSPSSYFLPKQR